jgi:acetyl-CoA C-acetyltransferase
VPTIPALTSLSCDPFFQRPVGLEEQSSAGLEAQAYLERYGVSEEVLAGAARKNLRNGLFNPLAHRKGDFSVEEVMASEAKALPLRELECAPRSDGACALLLASEERARELTDTPVWVNGFGWACGEYGLGDRGLLDDSTLREAASRAYAMAGIDRPREQLSLVECSTPYAHQEFLCAEGLGLCEPGDGWKLFEDGVTEIDGSLPVNPSGGVLCANPYIARGLIRVGEAALQLMGKAGSHQVRGAATALAHGTYGLAGQAHSVVVLGKE